MEDEGHCESHTTYLSDDEELEKLEIKMKNLNMAVKRKEDEVQALQAKVSEQSCWNFVV